MSPARELLRPRWVVAHVVILAVLITFPQLGMWQLDRWNEEKDLAARIEARVDGAPLALADVLTVAGPTDPATSLDDLEFTPVVATGTYLADEEVAHRNRALEGQAGFDWLTPLLLTGPGDDTAILVRRGFVTATRAAGSEPTAAPPPTGTVTVTGWLEVSGTQPGFGPSDADEGDLDLVFQADVARIDQQVSADLLPMILHLRVQDPSQPGPLPVAQPVPEVDTTQNLSYAGQWFAFTAIAAIGYAIVLWRRLRHPEPPSDPSLV